MKKRIISLLTIMTIITAMIQMPVFAAEEIVSENIPNNQLEGDLYLPSDEEAVEIEQEDEDIEDITNENDELFDSELKEAENAQDNLYDDNAEIILNQENNYEAFVPIEENSYGDIQLAATGSNTIHVWITDERIVGGLGRHKPNPARLGTRLYLCYEFLRGSGPFKYDGTDELYSPSGDYSVTETMYKPDGNILFSYSYENSNNNWISQPFGINEVTGKYRGNVTVSGCVHGSYDISWTVHDTIPTITRDVDDQIVTAGDPATFSVSASGTHLSYQWHYTESGGGSHVINGANSSFYTTDAVTPFVNRTYYCVISNYGNSSIRSSSASAVCQYDNFSNVLPSTKNAYIGTGGNYRYFSFRPDKTETYIFESVLKDGDAYGCLYNYSGTELANNDDDGDGRNCKIEYKLIAGNTYFFAVKYLNSSATGTIPVKLSMVQNVAMPTISVSNIAGGKSATISCSTSGATIYYTTNGSTPTTSSNRYNGAISLTSAGTTTIKAIAVKSGYNNSSVATQDVTVSRAATPAASPSGGTITSSTSVTLSCSTSGATIYYTTNGNTPTTSSTRYTGAININSTTTLKAIAVASGYVNSDIATYMYQYIETKPPLNSLMTTTIEDFNKADIALSYNLGQSISAIIVNNKDIPVDGTVIEVFKDSDNNILSIQTQDITIDSNEHYKFYDETNIEMQIDTVDLYFWDKLESMKPLAKKTIVWDKDATTEIQTEYIHKYNDKIISINVECIGTDENGTISVSELNDNQISNTAGALGNGVDIQLSEGDVRQANIIFKYDKTKLNNIDENSLGIAWFNPELGRMQLLENSVVDKINSTVSVQTNHFSEYVVVDTQEWYKQWAKSQMIIRDTTSENPGAFEVVFAIDVSGSMDDNSINLAKEAVCEFISNLQPQDTISLLRFDSSASNIISKQKLEDVDDWDNLYDTIMNFTATAGGTDIESALDLALHNFTAFTNDEKIIVLLSDGQDSISQSYFKNIRDVKVLTIGLGNVDATMMSNIASWTNGQYLYANNSEDLSSIYEQLRGEFIGYDIDTDGDGLPDKIELSGMRDQYGEIIYTDPEDYDTDGDRLSDGEEMGTLVVEESYPYCTYFRRISNPKTPTNKKNAEMQISQFIKINNSYDTIIDTVKLKSSSEMIVARDYLSETVHENVSGVYIEFETPSCLGSPSSVVADGNQVLQRQSDGRYYLRRDMRPGDTINLRVVFNCKNGGKLNCTNQHYVNVKVSGDNLDASDDKINVDFIEQWKNEQTKIENKIAKQILVDTMKEINQNGKKMEELNNKVKKSYIKGVLSGIDDDTSKDVAIEAYKKYLSELPTGPIKISLDNEGKTIQEIGNHINGANEKYNISGYTAHVVGPTFNDVGFLTIECINNKTKKSVKYLFVSSPNDVKRLINDYVFQLQQTYMEASKKAITEAMKDSLDVMGVYELLSSLSMGNVSTETQLNVNFLSNAVSIWKSRESMSGSKLLGEYKKYKSQVDSYGQLCSASLKSLTNELISSVSKIF